MRQTFVKAALVASCMATVACKQAPTEMGPGQYPVMTIATTDRTIPSNYSAKINGRQDIAIYPQVSGTITEVCFNEGQTVSKGQPLFIIDQVPIRRLSRRPKPTWPQPRPAWPPHSSPTTARRLFAKQVVSRYDLSTAENNLLTAKAQLAQAEAQRVNAANNLSYTVVKAPSNGVAGTIPYRAGALVSASLPQPLTTISDNSVMYVYFSITENHLQNLIRKYGSMSEVLKAMPEVQLRLNDGSVYDQAGRIEAISSVLDSSTGVAQCRAAFPNPSGLLISGSNGSVILPNEFKGVVVIPQSATFEIQDKVYVYNIVDGKASSKMISVEKISNGKEYIVNEGLTPGEQIVSEGVGLLREGTEIVAKTQPTAAPAAETEKPAAGGAAQTETEKEE